MLDLYKAVKEDLLESPLKLLIIGLIALELEDTFAVDLDKFPP
jgi:hypothetical protein